MPTVKQMEKLAALRGNVPPTPEPGDEMPPEYWRAVIADPLTDAKPRTARLSTAGCSCRKSPNMF